MTSMNHRDKAKTYLLAASGRRTIRNTPWIDDVPSESFTLPKYEVSEHFNFLRRQEENDYLMSTVLNQRMEVVSRNI